MEKYDGLVFSRFSLSLFFFSAALRAPMRGEQNRMKTSGDWCESNVDMFMFFSWAFSSLFLSRLIVNVPPLRSTRFISVASSAEQGKIHPYQQLLSCVPKVEYHPPAIRLQRGIAIIIIIIIAVVYVDEDAKNGRERKNIDSKQNAFVA